MSVFNPAVFIGEHISGATAGAPLSTDANGNLISGQNVIEVSSTASATAPTTTFALMTGMTITPTPGTYLVLFSCDIISGAAGAAVSCAIYNNGTQDASSLRKVIPFAGGTLTTGSARCDVAINRTVVVTTGAVEIHWETSNAGPTTEARTLTLVRIL